MYYLKKKRTVGSGFTLIELLIVVAIIGILSTMVGLNVIKANAKSRDAKRVADLKQIRTAVELHAEIKSVLPGTTNGCYYQSNHTPWWSASGATEFETDLVSFINPLPRDPKKGNVPLSEEWTELVYRYCRSGATYKLDAGMEIGEDLVSNDSGMRNSTEYNANNELNGRYEIGTNLQLMN